MRRVVINKCQWAVGIQWTMSSTKLSTMELRRNAKKLDPTLDLVAYRQRQHGFAASDGNMPDWVRVRALAASIRVASPSFLGLFCLEDQDSEFWWVFAMSQSLIVGMGDQVFATQVEASAYIQSLRGLLDNEFAETVTCEAVEDSLRWLSPLITSGPLTRFRRRSGYLNPLQPSPGQRRTLVVAGGLVALLLVGGYGLKSFLDHQEWKRAVEAARAAMLNKEEHRRELMVHPERYFAQGWATAPDVKESIQNSLEVMLSLPTIASGWALESATCDGHVVKVSWAHKPGADYVHLPPASRVESPQKAVSRLPIPAPAGTQRPVALLLSREESTQRIYQCTQLMGGRLKLVFNAPEKRVIDKVEIVAPWIRGQWELSDVPAALVLDASIPDALTTIPGMTLESITMEKNNWTFKGAVYATSK